MNRDLTRDPVTKSMLLFAIPMILGDLLQQCYNIADTLIVGQFLGRDALAAIGSAFTLMTFLTSIILGLCMGSGALFSMRFGQRDEKALCENLCASFFFIAQNYGAKESERIRAGLKSAVCISMAFCVVISALVFVFARPLMAIFVDAGETEVILEGVRYLRIEGAFYCGIGCLFLLYGLYRALGRPGMSVVLTVVSLGTRVALAYLLSAIPAIGVIGIWWSAPIGWALADLTGLFYYKARKKELLA